ncbi:MAG: hypothetical protein GF418_06255 [Chitinivibrionales bacterium]|nr:hypothetical protein [Chitinivibrionales bacterium]MBD3395213.1 hypothetical protein [Chitinivibrionales bacterium]
MFFLSILVGVAFFLIVVLVAIHIGMRSRTPDEPPESPTIHASGIYSIVRRSPRDSIAQFKPSQDELSQYLAGKNEDIQGKPLTGDDKKALVSRWEQSLEENIREVEAGDHQGVEFYYYDFDEDDPVCRGRIDQGHFVTREEIFKFPRTIPPFHIGCRCRLKAHHGSEDLRETTRLGMRPLFRDESLPPLPTWSDILKLS